MIPDEDLKIETVRVNPGGQQVGNIQPHIKVEHLPSDNYVVIRSERSNVKCKELAISMLEWSIISSSELSRYYEDR